MRRGPLLFMARSDSDRDRAVARSEPDESPFISLRLLRANPGAGGFPNRKRNDPGTPLRRAGVVRIGDDCRPRQRGDEGSQGLCMCTFRPVPYSRLAELIDWRGAVAAVRVVAGTPGVYPCQAVAGA